MVFGVFSVEPNVSIAGVPGFQSDTVLLSVERMEIALFFWVCIIKVLMKKR